MTTDNRSAKIYDMEDARARKRASELPGADYRDSGAHLAAVREAAGLSIDEAAARTHIKQRCLVAIEELNLSALPARPYAIGFVKTYAEFLELDAAAIVSRFKEDAGFSTPPPIEVEKFEAAEVAAEAEGRDLSLVAVVAIIFFILWCAWQIVMPREVELLGGNAGQAAVTAGSETLFAPTLPAGDPTHAPPLANVVEAVSIERIEPVYPRGCLTVAAPVETVVIAFNISIGGRVVSERIAQSSNACANQAALNALRRWRFSPQTVDGVPRTAYDQQVEFSFKRPL